MKKHILSPENIAPGRIIFDSLELDPSVSLEAQADPDLFDDMFAARFPNGCVLDISWYPIFDPSGSFEISLNQTQTHWDPFISRWCRSIEELKTIVAELVETAKNTPSVPQVVLDEHIARPAYLLSDDLVLDPMSPPESQLDQLREQMVRASTGKYRIQVGWLPPHLPAGEFVLTLSRASDRHDYEGPFELVAEKRCRSIAEMLELFKSLAVQAKQLEESDRPET